MIEMKIEGLAELRKALLELPKEVQQKTLKGAVAAAAKVVRDDARARVPVLFETGNYTAAQRASVLKRRKPGTLRKAIRSGFSKLNSSSVQVGFNVFVKKLSGGQVGKFIRATGKHSRANPDDAYYWNVWEFGNGVNNSRPFLRPAFDANRQKCIEVMRDKLAQGIAKAAAKLRWSK